MKKRSKANKMFREWLKFTADDWGQTEKEAMETLDLKGSKDDYEYLFGTNDEEEMERYIKECEGKGEVIKKDFSSF
jgi:hypothetical protein